MSRLIKKKKITVKKCYDKVEKFLSSIQCKEKTSLDLTEIVQKFKTFSRIKISKNLSPIDFYVVAEGILLSAKILTCDFGMYNVAKKYYDKIYLLTDQLKDKLSDLGRLINDIQRNR